MDYQKHYNLLVERAKTRSLDCYTETHHIIPRCMGGNNSKTNLVKLTPEEHYVAHQLLVKIYPKNSRLLYAATFMTSKKSTRNNKMYGWLRRQSAIYATDRKHTTETKTKLSVLAKGRVLSDQTKHKMSVAKKGKQQTQAAVQKRYKAVVVDGIQYASRSAAIKELGVNKSTFYKWLSTGQARSV